MGLRKIVSTEILKIYSLHITLHTFAREMVEFDASSVDFNHCRRDKYNVAVVVT